MKLGKDIFQEDINKIIKCCKDSAIKHNSHFGLSEGSVLWNKQDDIKGWSLLTIFNTIQSDRKRSRLLRFEHYSLVSYLTNQLGHSERLYIAIVKNSFIHEFKNLLPISDKYEG